MDKAEQRGEREGDKLGGLILSDVRDMGESI